MTPLTTWTCDVCGGPVTVDDGYVTWSHVNGAEHGFKIIHQSRCDRDLDSSSAALADFLGPDGLAKLTAFLSPGAFMVATYDPVRLNGAAYRIADLHQFVDFFRRVQLPFYEEARASLRSPSEDMRDLLSDSNEISPYLQSALRRWAADKG